MGLPGSSYAFEIAQKIGLPAALLNSAKQKIGHQQKKVDTLLADLEREKKEMAIKQNEMAIQTRKLNQLVQENQQTKDFFDTNKKKILKEAKVEVDQLIKSANKLVENTIADIKSVKADKEATKKIRNQFETAAIEIIKKAEPIVVPAKSNLANQKIKVGDWVVYGEDQILAEVLSIQKNKAELAIGDLHTWILLSKLQLTTNRTKKAVNQSAFSNVMANSANQFQPQIDIRGARGEEALWEVEKFLDKAIMLNYSEIRILHGKGDGILRKLIREYLKKYEVVSSVASENVEFGGDGITIVNLR
jgi:DNA mismatch repair protein MutS2